jgi:uncharacterized LabA/DUF88 family protein
MPENTNLKWLDLSKMSKLLFPNDEIVKIKYFTAPIKIRRNDSDHDKPNRQQIYWRALRTNNDTEIIEGTFLSHKISMKLADGSGYAEVIKTEEKETDVNIATHLVNDAHNKKFEKAVVISNDSDLVLPINIVVKEINLPITVISPHNRNSIELNRVASGIKKIRKGLLKASQFPEKLTDDTGTFHIPNAWKK